MSTTLVGWLNLPTFAKFVSFFCRLHLLNVPGKYRWMVWVHVSATWVSMNLLFVSLTQKKQNPRNAISTWACTKHSRPFRIVISVTRNTHHSGDFCSGVMAFFPLNKAVPATGEVVLGGVQVGPFDSHDYSWMVVTLLWHFGKVQPRNLGLHDPIGRTYVAQPPSSLGCFERFFLALLALHKDARDVVHHRNYLSISYHFPWRCEWPRNVGRAC